MNKKYILSIILTIFVVFSFSKVSFAYEEIIPKDLKLSEKSKIFGTTVPSTFAIFSFDPDLIAGWNTPLYDHEKKYLPKKYLDLPVLGGWYGNGVFPNKEVLLSSKFDAALVLDVVPAMKKKMEEYMSSIKVPLVVIKNDSLNDDVKMYSTLGKLFNNEKRANEINTYIQNAINNVENIKKQVKKKVRVYYADGENGLDTRCIDSIVFAYGENVHKCIGKTNKVTFEQLMIYNPDVIIADNENFFKSLKNNEKWKRLKAVKNNKVYLIPYEPFSWIRKKTIMEYYVVQYLADLFYPKYSKIDLEKELINHLKVFLNYDMTKKEAKRLVNYKGNK